MDECSVSEYCPKCQLVQPTFEFTEESRTVRRCMMCGFLVDSGLALEHGEVMPVSTDPPLPRLTPFQTEAIALALIGSDRA